MDLEQLKISETQGTFVLFKGGANMALVHWATAPSRHLRIPEMPWKRIGLAIIIIVGLTYAATSVFSDSAQVEPRQPETVKAAPEINPPAQTEPVTPTFPAIELDWVEIGTARNGEEVLALPIPWDRLVRKVTPENRAMFLKLEDLNRPPATEVEGVNPVSSLIGYLEGDGRITLYGYSNHRWSLQGPHPLLSYWKAEVKLSEL